MGIYILILDSGEGNVIRAESIDEALEKTRLILHDSSYNFGAFYYLSLKNDLMIEFNTSYFDKFYKEYKELQ